MATAREMLAALRAKKRPARELLAEMRVKTNLLDQQGIDAAEVKRRAAANEPIVQVGLRRATPAQEIGADIAGGAAGLVEGTLGTLGLIGDVASLPARAAGQAAGTLLGGGGVGDVR